MRYCFRTIAVRLLSIALTLAHTTFRKDDDGFLVETESGVFEFRP